MSNSEPSTQERRVVVSAFTEAEVKHQASVWIKQGYYEQGPVCIERVNFQEKTTRVSRVVYLQLMVKDAEPRVNHEDN
jgi:hypothetical protein